MPGYVTHYIFGRDIYDHLKDSLLKQNLYINRAVYSLGQQGPRIFSSTISPPMSFTDTTSDTWHMRRIRTSSLRPF